MVGGPILGASLLLGLTISLIQAATQVSEPTLAFVPKLIGVLVVLAVFGPWMTHQMLDFTRRTLAVLPTLTR